MKTKQGSKLGVIILCVLLASALAFGAVGCKKKTDPPAPVAAPVVTGVSNNGVYYLGKDTIVPAYDKGEGMMSKDGGVAYAFASGTAVTALGDYVLTVTYANGDDPKTTTVSFKVAEYFVEYPAQITDMFDNTRLGDGYILDAGVAASVKDGVATFANKEGGDPWSIVKRKFAKVNATANPYLEIKVDRIANGSNSRLELCLSNTEYATDKGSVGELKLGEIGYTGIYHYDILSVLKTAKLDETEQDLFLILKVVGKSAGYAAADIDYYKSVASIPAAEPAQAYLDDTAQTLGTWREDTVKYEIVEDVMYAFVDPGHDENYGRMIKRVALNTKDYPYLTVDVASVAPNTSWNLKVGAEGINGEMSLTGDSSATGRVEIDLGAVAELKDKENIAVTLAFYVIGKGDDKIVGINGFETLAESERAPALNEDFTDTAAWSKGGSVQEVTLAVAERKGTFTLVLDAEKNDDHYACIDFSAQINTIENRYLVLDIASAAADHTVKLNGAALYAQGKTTGKIYIDMQKENSGFARGYNVPVKLEFYLIGDNGQTVVLDSITTSNEAPDKNLVEDFAKADWVSGVGSNTVAGNKMKLVKNANEEMGKAEKSFAMDTTADHVLKFGVAEMNAGWDAGFSIKISNRTVDKWPTITVKGDSMTKIERAGGGWDIYVDLKALADANENADANLDAAKFVGEVTLTFEIVLESGDAEKSVTFDSIRLVGEVPAVS